MFGQVYWEMMSSIFEFSFLHFCGLVAWTQEYKFRVATNFSKLLISSPSNGTLIMILMPVMPGTHVASECALQIRLFLRLIIENDTTKERFPHNYFSFFFTKNPSSFRSDFDKVTTKPKSIQIILVVISITSLFSFTPNKP